MSKLISQGGFGCIFYPGFNCKGKVNTDSKMVSKLQINNFNGINEIFIGKKIKQFIKYNLFFLPVVNSCPIGIASLDKKSIEKCNIISKRDSDYLLLEIPYLKNISFQKLFTNFLRNKKHILLIFFDTFQYIIDSIQHLIDLNIVHFDLKEQNILYSIKYENPILIDFGISIPFDKLNNNNIKDYLYIYAPDYFIWPLEVHVICYLLHIKDKLEFSDIQNIVSEYVSNNIGLNIFSHNFKLQYANACIEYLKQFVTDKNNKNNKNNKTDKNDIIKELLLFYKSWDLYALSILYLKFFGYIFHNGFYDSKIILKFSQLLLINISPDPRKRLSIKNIKLLYKEIFYMNETSKNYLELINNFKYHNIPIKKMKKEMSILYTKNKL